MAWHAIGITFFTSCIINVVVSQNPIQIDLEGDIPKDGNWVIDCEFGYEQDISRLICDVLGRVDLPEEDNYGQQGFWTKCVDRCRIKYIVQPGDKSFAARVYQRAIPTEVSYDGVSWEFVPGEGWVDIKKDLGEGITEVSLQLDHLAPEYFALLDKIAINAELPPLEPVSPGTSTTTEPTPSTTTTNPTTTTTVTPPETTSETPEHTTSEAPDHTTSEPEIPTTKKDDPTAIHVDVESDIPRDGNWIFDCPEGYKELVSDFNCTDAGKVDLPEEDNYGQRGFWTKCTDRCRFTYMASPADVSFAIRLYQRNVWTEISFNGISYGFIDGEGWIDVKKDLEGIHEISLALEHYAPDYFAMIDRIAINAVLPPPPEHTTPDPTTSTTTPRDPSTIYIDVEDDIPSNGNWIVDCPDGYEEQVWDFNCTDSGNVDLPRDDLSGQEGFWTTCVDRCQIKYLIQPGDSTFAARVYQRILQTEVSYDGETWEFIPGDGWVEIRRDLRPVETEISLRFDHLTSEYFVVLDKIAVNGDLPPWLAA